MRNDHAREIIRELAHICYTGVSQSDIYDDWLDIVLETLKSIPAHLRSAVTNGTLAEDAPETQKIFKRIMERYRNAEQVMEHFGRAFYILMDSADAGDGSLSFADTVGEAYMEWGMPNKWQGQFFTPFEIAQLMARITFGNIEEMLMERLEAAYRKSPYGIMHAILTPERVSPFVREMGAKLLPLCAEHFDPITVNDPACGSGVMFLAAAECCPRWALDWGLVQFYGQDIDPACVKMAQINILIYGLNSTNIKNALALAEAELQTIPQPYQDKYREAQANPERADEIAAELRAWMQPVLL